MWSFRERGLYCVRTTTLSIRELTQFDRVKSMIRYLPPNGTAGFARTDERIDRRSPSPPARMTAIVRFMAGMLAPGPWRSGQRQVKVRLREGVRRTDAGSRSSR